MQCENRSRQPRARHLQAHQHQPDQERVGNMKEKVDPMVAGGVKSPERVLDPKRGINQRKILRRRFERKPNSAETIGRRQQLVIRYILIIVPNKSSMRHSAVGNKNNANQKETPKPVLSPEQSLAPAHLPTPEGRVFADVFIVWPDSDAGFP